MVLDGQGFLWIADGWLALAVGSFVMGLALWCHDWIATGRPRWPSSARGRRLARALVLRGGLLPRFAIEWSPPRSP